MLVMWERIETYMAENGLTWVDMSELLGVSTAAMSHWKSGKTSMRKRYIYKLEQLEAAARNRSNSQLVGNLKSDELLGTDEEEAKAEIPNLKSVFKFESRFQFELR